MAHKMLDEKTTYMTETPMLPVFQDKPEPPRRQAKKLDLKQSARHIDLSDADFSVVKTWPGFPQVELIPSRIPGNWSGDKPGYWDVHLERWRDARIAERDELIRLFPLK